MGPLSAFTHSRHTSVDPANKGIVWGPACRCTTPIVACIHRDSSFRNHNVLWGEVIGLTPNPQPGGPGFFCRVFLPLVTVILHLQQIKEYRPLFNAKSFRKCIHKERGGSHLEWTASLCTFSVPALWNSSPTAHHNDAILHSLKQALCSALHSKMSIQKEGTCLVKVKYSNDSQKLFNFYGAL